MLENKSSTIPALKVEVDGKEISQEALAAFESAMFEEEINTASMFVLKLSSFDYKESDWKFIDLEDFHLGSETKLYMGMDSNNLMMTGEIVAIEPHFGRDMATVEIRSYDKLHRLGFGKKQRTFSDVKDSDVASVIAGDWGLSSKVESTQITHPYLCQNNQNDLEFLLERTRRLRYELSVNDSTLFFRPSKENDSPSLTLEYRLDLEEFNVKLKAVYEGSEFLVKGWDFMKKEIISASAADKDKISEMGAKEIGTKITKSAFGSSSSSISSAVVDEQIESLSDAERLAAAKYNTHLVNSVTGEGKCAGIPELRAGKTISVKGIGRFSGTYYITSTSHVIDSEGYSTSFKVRRVGI
ncbi:MAG: phage late control D family protein [Methanosarcina sp.]